MWTQLVAAWMSNKSSKGGDGAPDATRSQSSAISDATLDSSNWTVSTGSSKATGGTASPETQKTALWVIGGIAAAAVLVTAVLVLRGHK